MSSTMDGEPRRDRTGRRSFFRTVGSVVLAGAGVGIAATAANASESANASTRVYGPVQQAVRKQGTQGGSERIPASQVSTDLQPCAEYCYVEQCNSSRCGGGHFSAALRTVVPNITFVPQAHAAITADFEVSADPPEWERWSRVDHKRRFASSHTD